MDNKFISVLAESTPEESPEPEVVEAAQVEPVEVEEEPEAALATADVSEVAEDVEDATDPLVEDSKMEEEEKVEEVSRQFLSK